jgi:hypothetical protein
MTDEAPTQRYRTMEPTEVAEGVSFAEQEEAPSGRPLDRAVRYLTWGILGACLAVWAVIGFLLWVPLMLRSMVRFSVSLAESMLQGAKPAEAGRILRETVEFYRRGFTVAIDAVFGPPPKKQEAESRLTLRRILLEILWAVVIWYVILYAVGFVELSPLDVWNAIVAYPWGETIQSTVDWVTGILGSFGGGEETAAPAAALVDSVVPQG